MPGRNAAGTQRRQRAQSDLFARLETLAHNLWWTWNSDARRLFAALDPARWEASNHNPLRVLAELTPARRVALEAQADFLKLLANVEQQLRSYLKARTWYDAQWRRKHKRVRVAYFCAEFGLHESFPQYAGGLGILAGDHLKSASDLGVPLVAVGLLYQCGYYEQSLGQAGDTQATFVRYDRAEWPLEDTGVTISVPLGRRSVQARVWRVQVGRVPLYMLDTDLPSNKPRDRAITERLYGGDQEMRIRQEILLGVGGTRALAALGERVSVFHLNEGHAAFCGLERLREQRAAGRSAEQAQRRVRNSTLFTTHTPVPAGHDRFPPTLVTRYLGGLAAEAGLSRTELLALGRENQQDRQEPFCMTVLALRLSNRANGVSKLHGAVSQEMWTGVFGAERAEDVPIGYITNGVHSETWLAEEARPLYDRYLRPHWTPARPQHDPWQNVERIPPAELWELRDLLRRRLVGFVRERLQQQLRRRCAPTSEILAAMETFDERALTIGFARRFATYKRAVLVFSNAQRIAKLLNDPQRPVQIVFAGKAHPADGPGQGFAQKIYQYARRTGFRGRIALLENYDMHVGRMLVSGCDVWLNTPLRPQEASGTSGMKPPLHGGLNCSIMDGWWAEGFNGRNGWAIGDETPLRGRATRDRRDADALYELLEQEIVPLFYRRDRAGVPREWVRRMKNSMKSVCAQFSTHRMLAEYMELYCAGAD